VPPDSDDNLRLEIRHVLFIDIVGYSKLLNEEQKERLNQLIEIVLATAPVREATDEQLVRLPTGDGMALVFRHSAEEPARCALEIAEALQKHPELPVRMGIHSGPVSEVTDVSGRANLAGAGINMAQRVMDCGDAGHILLSQHVADDLVHSRQWASRLRDLGECEVKHGVRLHLVNLYAKPLGNAAHRGKTGPAQQRRMDCGARVRRDSCSWRGILFHCASIEERRRSRKIDRGVADG
jgi:class 3 adenylate cyclase